MRIDIGQVFREALAIWRQERDVIVRIAGLLLFLPLFASGLLVAPSAPSSGADANSAEAMQKLADAILATIPWSLAVMAFAAIGTGALFLWGARRAASVGSALVEGLSLALPLFLAAILVRLLVAGGLILFIVPGLYLIGRTYLFGAVTVFERQRNPLRAIERSFVLTRGHGWTLLGVTALIFVSGDALVLVLSNLRVAISPAGSENPVAVVILVAIASFVGAITAVADLLVKIAIYRRLAASSNGT